MKTISFKDCESVVYPFLWSLDDPKGEGSCLFPKWEFRLIGASFTKEQTQKHQGVFFNIPRSALKFSRNSKYPLRGKIVEIVRDKNTQPPGRIIGAYFPPVSLGKPFLIYDFRPRLGIDVIEFEDGNPRLFGPHRSCPFESLVRL